jgi:phospholipid transport system substrate-binding protein
MHTEFSRLHSPVRTRVRAVWGLLILVLLCPVPGLAAGQQPVDVIRSATTKVLAELEETPQIRSDPLRLNAVIERHILPHVDLLALSRLTLGKNWRAATREQRSSFAREFGVLLIKTYSTALASFTSQEIEYLSSSVSAQKRRAIVRTRIVEDGLAPLAVDYSLRLVDGAWRVYDVKIEGVSLAINYRSSFAQEIRDHGIEGLIERLGVRNRDAQGSVPLARAAVLEPR